MKIRMRCAVPPKPGRGAARGGFEHVAARCTRKASGAFHLAEWRARFGSYQSSRSEELHFQCEVRMIGVAQCGQRGLLGLALGFSSNGDLPPWQGAWTRSLMTMRGRPVSVTSSASSSASKPRCRWRSVPARPDRSGLPNLSAVPGELLLDRLVVLVEHPPERFDRGKEPLLEPGFEER